MAGFDTALEQFIGQNTPEKLKAREANPLITPASRSFLFLQGVCSPFFSRLTKSLRDIGQQVQCVNFNVGDVLYNPGARTFCLAHAAELESFYRQTFHSLGVTDLVLFGDCRPVHLPAIALARSAGIRVHVFEEGYFRPYWVTLERGGVNNHSQLPSDPDWYREVGKFVPRYDNGTAFKQSFAARATHDVLYHCGGALNKLFFPNYRTHAPFTAATEYAGYIRRGARLLLAGARDDAVVEEVARERNPTFLLPLQLDSDTQIKDHSPFNNMSEVIDHVLASFAAHAPGDARLVVKDHPLTPGLVNYQRITKTLAKHYDVADRVDFLDSGHMPTLLSHIAGLITINSTAGASALLHQRPTFVLANPIYALPGLTQPGKLEDFWTHPVKPDMTLFHHFRNTVIHTTQINGGFYTRSGIDMAVNKCLDVLMAKTSRIENFL